MTRIVVGLVLVPVIATAVTLGLLVLAVEWPITAPWFPPMLPLGADLVFIVSCSMALAVTLALLGALPLTFRLRRSRRPTAVTCALAGAVLGALPFLLFGVVAFVLAVRDRALTRLGGAFTALAPFLIIGAIAGASSAVAFYVVSLRGNAFVTRAT